MASPVFNAMGNNGNNNMMQQFGRFMQQMKGKDPNQEIQRLLQSGQINQEHLNAAQQRAQQIQHMFSGFFGK